jgi:flagellar biosynthesis protein FlhA
VRAALGRKICQRYQSPDGTIRAFILSAEAERAIQNNIQLNETGQILMLDPQQHQTLHDHLADAARRHEELIDYPIVVCPPRIRRHVKKLFERHFPRIVVLSYSEIVAGVQIENLETIEIYRPGETPPEPEPPKTISPTGTWDPDQPGDDVMNVRW